MTVRRTFTEMVEAGEPLMQQALQAIRDAKAVDPSGSSATGGWGCLKHLNERWGLGSNGTENQRKHELEFALLVCDC